MKSKTNLIVNGEKIKLDRSKLKIVDVDKDMRTIASLLSHWGEVLAIAKEERDKVDAYYRSWRAKEVQRILSSHKKLSAEYKVKAIIESQKKFLDIKNAIAKADRNVNTLQTHYDSLKTKAFLLPSKGARDRDVLNADGMNTKGRKKDG